MNELLNLLNDYQAEEVKNLLSKTIELYNSNSVTVDYIEIEERIINDMKDLPHKHEQNNVIKLNKN